MRNWAACGRTGASRRVVLHTRISAAHQNRCCTTESVLQTGIGVARQIQRCKPQSELRTGISAAHEDR
eukprot:362101-Chlamydomonas_euryale.AAC.5